MSPFLAGVTWLIVFQCAGEAVVWASGAPVPGPVVGMGLLLAALALRGGRDADPAKPLGAAADGFARHLSLLFVPAGVGVMLHAGRLSDEGVALAAALAGSTALALAVAGLVFQAMVRRADRRDSGAGEMDRPE
ncbi:MAG: CidA/LrgA family protein [Burkholderiales bacterium]|nr:CidA/LrgA family protein [Burkholderiales bacterium]